MYQERPFLLPFIAMASGLVISDRAGILLHSSSVALIFLCLVLSSFIARRDFFVICMALFFFSWGMCALAPWKNPPVSTRSIVENVSREPVTVEGIIQARPTVSPVGSSFILRTEHLFHDGRPKPVSGDVMMYVSEGDISFNRGDRIRCRTKITVPHQLGLPGEFDYPRFLSFQGVAAVGRVASDREIVLIRGAAAESLLRLADMEAGRMGNFIRTSVGDNDTSAVLNALLIGDQKRISGPLTDAYTRAGVNHILSVSGFHVGVIVYFIVSVMLLIATLSESLALHLNLRRLVLLLTVPAMVLYLLMTGSAPATARSVIMLTVFVLALCAERETDPVNMLLMSATLLLAINPPTLFDVSFQLSFLALWGIVVLVPPIMDYAGAVSRNWLRSLIQFTAVSCAASIATVVPVLFIFNQSSLNGIVTNFLIVPLLGYGAVLIGFCAMPFIYLWPPVANLLIAVAAQIVVLSNWLIAYCSHLPVVRFYGTSAFDMLMFILCMSAITFVKHRGIKLPLSAVFACVALATHLYRQPKADGLLHITMLSVGQAESLLVRLPDGAAMLVDGGGYLRDSGRDFGEKILVPALRKLGIHQLDYLVMTHSHPDHVGGLPYVASTLPIGTFLESIVEGGGDSYVKLRTVLNGNRVPVRRLAAGDALQLSDRVSLQVLSPSARPRQEVSERDEMGMNEDSLVFRLEYGAFSMLFTADAGFPTESRMMNDGADLRATVLKVGHHGSRYSTSDEFLDKIRPQAALISAGRNNSFGLPAQQTLDHFFRRKIAYFRTDLDGTIDLQSDGRSWSISTPYRTD